MVKHQMWRGGSGVSRIAVLDFLGVQIVQLALLMAQRRRLNHFPICIDVPLLIISDACLKRTVCGPPIVSPPTSATKCHEMPSHSWAARVTCPNILIPKHVHRCLSSQGEDTEIPFRFFRINSSRHCNPILIPNHMDQALECPTDRRWRLCVIGNTVIHVNTASTTGQPIATSYISHHTLSTGRAPEGSRVQSDGRQKGRPASQPGTGEPRTAHARRLRTQTAIITS